MSKYKRKHKKNRILLIGIMLILVLILMGTGYSLFSDTLHIQGIANLKYKEPKIEKITVNKTNGEYFNVEQQDDLELKFVKNIESTAVKDGEEKIEIIGDFDIGEYSVEAKDVKFNVSFTNNYPVTITNGRAELLENTTKYSVKTSQTETIATNATGTFSITITLKEDLEILAGSIKYKLSYKEGEITKYLYVTINLT